MAQNNRTEALTGETERQMSREYITFLTQARIGRATF